MLGLNFWLLLCLTILSTWLIVFLLIRQARTEEDRKMKQVLHRIGINNLADDASVDRFKLQARIMQPIGQVLNGWLDRAGLLKSGSLHKLMLLQVFGLVVVFLVFFVGLGSDSLGLRLLAIGFLFTPVGFVLYKYRERQALMRKQFPDMLDSLVRSLYAGHGIDTALAVVANEFSDPLASEIAEINNAISMGVGFREALQAFRTKVPLDEAQYFAITLMIQRETGGRLAEILNDLALVMRRRESFQAKLKTLTAESRFTAWFIGGAPVAFLVYKFLFDYPSLHFFMNDPTGQKLFVFAVLMIAAGTLILRWMLRIRF
ncbi:type II secretion system F family protein [Thiomicrospira microaerophila]|uniref:type II secretion system F family protein n=1 Tax=Thiomicrospira microaerophila TaxID=406020 RepID=UPI00200F8FB7|nr:type II secretion system F family protein [Thiomicrospira microaerophila]UQB43068.1 type II secretion system F family protein [Thiomicrospira microaerophila]